MAGYAAGYDVDVAVIGNKTRATSDAAFLREHAGRDCSPASATSLPCAPWSRAPFRLGRPQRGDPPALTTLQRRSTPGQGLAQSTRQATEFHLKNARAWASAAAGEDLATQIDPGFAMGPEAFLAATP